MKRNKKMNIILFFVVLLTILLFIFVVKIFVKKTVTIDMKKSRYNDFVIEKDDVYIYCWLTFSNNSGEEKNISIEGDFFNDFNSGLLQDEFLQGKFIDTDSYNLILNPKEKKKRVKVVFIGKKGNNSKKANKLLPKIKVIENN